MATVIRLEDRKTNQGQSRSVAKQPMVRKEAKAGRRKNKVTNSSVYILCPAENLLISSC
jgi:hypothetical protein